MKKAIVDGLATFCFLVLLLALSTSMKILPFPVPEFAAAKLPLLIPFAAFVALGSVARIFGWVSGAHVNWAVSLGQVASRQMSVEDMLAYWFFQMVGGLAAFMFIIWRMTGSFSMSAAGQYVVEPTVRSVWRVGALEALGTFLLASGVHLAAKRRWDGWAVIGAALGVSAWAFGSKTGGSFNPVRALAPLILVALGGGTVHWGFTLTAYVAFPLAGAGLAGLLFRPFFRAEESAPPPPRLSGAPLQPVAPAAAPAS